MPFNSSLVRHRDTRCRSRLTFDKNCSSSDRVSDEVAGRFLEGLEVIRNLPVGAELSRAQHALGVVDQLLALVHFLLCELAWGQVVKCEV